MMRTPIIKISLTILAISLATPALADWTAETTKPIQLRSGASSSYRVIYKIPAFDVVKVNYCAENQRWCNVTYSGKTGYARRNRLQRLSVVTVRPRDQSPSRPRVSDSDLGFEYDTPYERQLLQTRDPDYNWGWGWNPGPRSDRPNGF